MKKHDRVAANRKNKNGALRTVKAKRRQTLLRQAKANLKPHDIDAKRQAYDDAPDGVQVYMRRLGFSR